MRRFFFLYSSLLLLGLSIYYTLFSIIPYSVFVDITSYTAHDVCVGSDTVTYSSERVPRWGIEGETWGQIVRFDDDEIIETSITRGSINNPVSFAYEPNTDRATYDTKWSEPFDEVGTYGANEFIAIYPLPYISIKKFNPATDTKFNVVECN